MSAGSESRNGVEKIVVVFGDSITEGADLPVEERGLMWVREVERLSAGKLQMVNEGKGGRPTDSLEEFSGMLVRQPKADLLVLALGGNDARDVSGNCVSNALSNLRAMIAHGRQAYGEGVSILLVGPTNIRKDALGPTRNIADEREQNLKDLNAAYIPLAAELGCSFVSLYGVVAPECLTVDGVHPDRDGHAAIAGAILPSILKAAGTE